MNTLIKIILFLGLSYFSTTIQAQTVTVMSFNIRFGELADMQTLARVISKQKADFVALQEVDIFTERDIPLKAGKTNYIAQLGGFTNKHAIFGKTIPYAGGEYGIGLLSEQSFETTANVPYKAKGTETRTALEAILKLENGQIIRFVCTHLDHNNDSVRRLQVEELIKRYEADTLPTIIAGDFNESSDKTGGCIARMTEVFKQACNPKQPTFPSLTPRVKIDYVFCHPANRWQVKSSRVIDVKNTSDHRAIVVKLKLKYRYDDAL